MAENNSVQKFMERFERDPLLRQAYTEAESAYPGSLEIREAVVEDVLLPLARREGYDFSLEDLRRYETELYLRKHRDEEQDSEAPDDDTVYFLLERGWTNDEAKFNSENP